MSAGKSESRSREELFMTSIHNAAHYFVDRHLSEGRGAKTAYIEADGEKRTLTYAELADGSDQVAGALIASGINREERAALFLLDTIEFPQVFFGAMKAGVVPIPLNTLLATSVYQAILLDSRATIAFVSAALLPVVAPAIEASPYIRKVVIQGEASPDHGQAFKNFLKVSKKFEAIEVSPDDTAFWLYSSGSTGVPKGVRHVHSSMQATSETYGAQVLGIREDDIGFSAAKFFFAYGLGNAVSFPLSVGATTVLFSGRPTPDVVDVVLREHKPTIFYGVPTLYAATVAHYEKVSPPNDIPLRHCVSAGEALPEEIGKKWASIFGADILDGVGSTEMLHIFLSNAPGNVVYGTSGVAVPGYEIRLVDENGQTLTEPGSIGELLVNGSSSADGYWNQREKSRATFEGVWTRTGDKYELNADRRLVYCGRTDDMFKVSGIWVSPFEVEQAIISHPAVLEAAVVPARDEKDLEKPKAFVVLKDQSADATALAGEIKDLVKDSIGKWKYPRWVEIVDELPKTATGKIQRFKLR